MEFVYVGVKIVDQYQLTNRKVIYTVGRPNTVAVIMEVWVVMIRVYIIAKIFVRPAVLKVIYKCN